MVDAVSGEGRTGLEGFVSELKVRMSERASGTGGALALLAKVVPPAPLRRDRMLLRDQRFRPRDGPSWLWRRKDQLSRQHPLCHAHLSVFVSTDHSGVPNLIRRWRRQKVEFCRAKRLRA